MAFGRTLLSSTSGWVVERIGWFDFFIVSTLVALPGLVLLVWIMRNLPISKQTTDGWG
jgi:PAT family beta-lactamase induction signal transducer AmpG